MHGKQTFRYANLQLFVSQRQDAHCLRLICAVELHLIIVMCHGQTALGMRLPFSSAAPAAARHGHRLPFNILIRVFRFLWFFRIFRFLPGLFRRLRSWGLCDSWLRSWGLCGSWLRSRSFFRNPLKGVCSNLFNGLCKTPVDSDTVQKCAAADFFQQAVRGKNDFLQFGTVAKRPFPDFLHAVRQDNGFEGFIAQKCIRPDHPDPIRDGDHFA